VTELQCITEPTRCDSELNRSNQSQPIAAETPPPNMVWPCNTDAWWQNVLSMEGPCISRSTSGKISQNMDEDKKATWKCWKSLPATSWHLEMFYENSCQVLPTTDLP